MCRPEGGGLGCDLCVGGRGGGGGVGRGRGGIGGLVGLLNFHFIERKKTWAELGNPR